MKGTTIWSMKKMEFNGWGSKPLLEFLASIGKDTNQELSKLDVSSLIIEYCKQNKLFHPLNKKKIICDSSLEALFGRKSMNRNSIYSLLTTHLVENSDLSDDDSGSTSENVDGDDFIVQKRRKQGGASTNMNRKGKEVVADVQKCCYAAIIPENVKLVYLRKSLVEKLSKEIETFEDKVTGSFVRVKSDPNDSLQRDSYQLVQVTGIKKPSITSGSEILLKVSGMLKEVPISKISDDDFTKEECEDLCWRIKTGLLNRPTVAELGQKTRSLHEDITNDWLARELTSLRNLINQATEKGWKREHTNYIDSLLLLQTLAEQSRLLKEVPEVIADKVELQPAYEDPITKGDEDTLESQEAALGSTADLSNDDCAKSSEGSSSEGNSDEGDAEWTIDAIRSTMTPTSLEIHRITYSIPDNIVLRIPEAGERASSPPKGEVALHSIFFEFGINLPFHPFLRYMLSHLQCAPAQLSPNAWRAIIGTYVIWKQCQFSELTFREFQRLYQLKTLPKSCGWYYFSTWPGKEAMVIDSPSSNKPWKNKWFFASGHWEADPNEKDLEHRIPTTFRTPAMWKKPPMLTEEQESNINTAFAIPSKDRSCKVLLTPENLQRYLFTLPSSKSSQKKRYLPDEKIPVGIPIKVSTKQMRVRSFSQEEVLHVSGNNQRRYASVYVTPPLTPRGSPISPVILVDGTKQPVPAEDSQTRADDQEKAQQEPKKKYLAYLTNEWSQRISPQEVEQVQMLSLEEVVSRGLSHNMKAVYLALDLEERIKALEGEKKILFNQVGQTVDRNTNLQGQLDEERAVSASLREHIVALKAIVTDATYRANEAEARAEAAERENGELKRVNKELKASISGWEEAAIKQLSSQQKQR